MTELDRALGVTVGRLTAFKPARIVGEPHIGDAHNLIDDLLAIAAIVDPLIAAYGEYARSHFGRIDQSLFADQLLGALLGNATFAVEQAARTFASDYPGREAEQAAEFERE
jgi:hypothetical protein